MLMEDHKRVKRAFRDGEKQTGQEDDDGFEQIVRQTCAELTVHATIEEELFYPALRKEIRETDLIEEADVEHHIGEDAHCRIGADEFVRSEIRGDVQGPRGIRQAPYPRGGR